MPKLFVKILFFCACVCVLQAKQAGELDYSKLKIAESKPNFDYVLLSSGVVLAGSVGGALVLYMLPENVTNWQKNEIVNLGSNWARKVSRSPVADRDDWVLNWITHPYWGAVYYMQPRKAGFGWFESTLFSFAASAIFWEYGIEAFAETPSWQDLVVTPAFGSLLGEAFYQASKTIESNNRELFGSRSVGEFALIVLDPVGALIELTKLDKHFGITKSNTYANLAPTFSRSGGSGVMLSFYHHW